MFTTLFTAALFIAPAIQGALADFAVNTPALVQCQSAKISWEATDGPYNVIIVPSSAPCGDIYADAGDHDTTSIDWTAAVPAGLKVQISIEDAKGDEAWSGIITVGASNDASCVSSELRDFAAKELGTSASSSASGSSAVASAATSALTSGKVATAVATSASSTSTFAVVGAVGAGVLGDNNGASTVAKSSIMLLGAVAAITAFVL